MLTMLMRLLCGGGGRGGGDDAVCWQVEAKGCGGSGGGGSVTTATGEVELRMQSFFLPHQRWIQYKQAKQKPAGPLLLQPLSTRKGS